MTDAEKSAKFRRDAKRFFRLFIIALLLVAVGIIAGGWWLLGWWGLAVGAILAILLLVGGLTAGTMLYAMSQDGA